eukprot:g19607.t1
MIIRWQKYIVATPKGDIAYWLDENRLTELQIQRDYGGKIPNEFFTAQLLPIPESPIPEAPTPETVTYVEEHFENTTPEQATPRTPEDQPSPIQAILDDEDEDQQPHFKETTHEHTTIQPLERAMRPDLPTHEQGLQEEQKSDQQDEISIEQSLADDQDTNFSTGPMPSSDFTAPEEPHTDPNRYIDKKPPPKGLTWEQSNSVRRPNILVQTLSLSKLC